MNIRDLQYLVALADYGHFGKAAEACFVSQPALSIQIKKLEDDLGVKLLERNNKSLFLTDIGITIVQRARQILNQVQELRDTAKIACDPLRGDFRLGIFPTLAPYLLPHIMPLLSQSLPDVSFYLVEEKTDFLLDQLKGGLLDAAILSLPLSDDTLMTEFLFEEAFLLAVPHGHPLAKKPVVLKEEIDHNHLLLLEEGHCMKNQVLSFCYRIDAPQTQRFRATSIEALRHMVVAGAGITLMPKLSTAGFNLISYIPFSPPQPRRSIGLVYRKTTSKTVLLTSIGELIKQIAERF